MVPAVLAMIIMVMTMMLTAMAVVRESEVGTMEQLLVTPLKPVHLIVGKLVWGVMICTIQMAIIFGLGILASNFKGHRVLLDIPGFLLLTLALAGASTSLGLLIASTRLPAMIALAPMLLGGVLGGAIIFTDILPAFIQPVSFLMPQRYGVDGYVDLIGRGGDLITVLPEAAFLLLFTVFFTVIAIWRFDPLD
jgi:ABC-2 type transport system permease protein